MNEETERAPSTITMLNSRTRLSTHSLYRSSVPWSITAGACVTRRMQTNAVRVEQKVETTQKNGYRSSGQIGVAQPLWLMNFVYRSPNCPSPDIIVAMVATLRVRSRKWLNSRSRISTMRRRKDASTFSLSTWIIAPAMCRERLEVGAKTGAPPFEKKKLAGCDDWSDTRFCSHTLIHGIVITCECEIGLAVGS